LTATSVLRQRVSTALLLGPLTLAAALCLPTGWLALALTLVILLGAWEWTILAGLSAPAPRVGYLAVMSLGCALLWWAHLAGWGAVLLAHVALGWFVLALYLARLREIRQVQGAEPALLVLGLPVLLGPWLALVELDAIEPNGHWLVLALLLLIWVADITAYFAGRRWGRIKLAPILSPGKTRAGCYAALAAAAAFGLALAWLLGIGLRQGLAVVVICLLTTVVSIVGDLFESLLKRRRGLKDSGRLLPGHGGVLDRVDSMTAAAPVFTLGLRMLL